MARGELPLRVESGWTPSDLRSSQKGGLLSFLRRLLQGWSTPNCDVEWSDLE